MIASILIIGFSLVLFLYWFRYTCLLILSAKSIKDYSRQVANANQLSFITAQGLLSGTHETMPLDNLRNSLDRDYRLLTCLMSHAPGFQLGGFDIEHRMLMIDYFIMNSWYSVSRKLSAAQSQSALREMADIVAHFANTMGERGAATMGASA